MRRRDGLRFAGRTPTAMGAGDRDFARGSLASRARLWAAWLLAAIVLLCAVNASRRGALGDSVPWPAERTLRIFDSSVSAGASGAASTWARARLVDDGRGWPETFAALPTFAGEWAHRLAPSEIGTSGAAWAIAILWLCVWAWWLAAFFAGWKRPSRGLALLILAQGFGASLWLGAMRAPARRIVPASTCRAFDFGARTVSSGGLLTASQSAAWHRARGFSGVALGDASGSAVGITLLPSVDVRDSAGNRRRVLFTEATPKPRGAGALWIRPRAWLPEKESSFPAQATEAWSGSVGDVSLARQSRAKGIPVVGSAGSGSDCFVWTLLPSEARTPSQVLAAIRQRRVAVAYATLDSESPASLEARRVESRRLGAVAKSWREAESRLSRAQKINLWLQVLAVILALFLWGSRAAGAAEAPEGPGSVAAFVRRKRLLRRANGLAAMALAFAGSAWAAGLLGSWGGAVAVLAAWLAADALYLWGRGVWRRVH